MALATSRSFALRLNTIIDKMAPSHLSSMQAQFGKMPPPPESQQWGEAEWRGEERRLSAGQPATGTGEPARGARYHC